MSNFTFFNIVIMSDKSIQLNDLGDEIVAFVFSFLDIRERIRCELVCRKWRQIFRSLPIRSVCVQTDSGSRNQPIPRVCPTTSHHPRQQDTIQVSDKQLKQTLHGLFVKYRHLHSLVIECHDIRALRKQEFFAFMKPYMSQLVHLELDFTYGPFVKEDLMHMNRSWNSTLIHLIIRYRRDRGKIMTEKCIMKLFEPCINLEVMCWDSPEIVEQRFEYFPNNLVELHIPSGRISSQSMEMLGVSNGEVFRRLHLGTVQSKQFDLICCSVSQLESLSIGSLEVNGHSLAALVSLHNLHTLEFGLSNLVDLDCDVFADQMSIALNRMTRLHSLHLSNVPVDDRFLLRLPDTSPRLRSLRIVCSDQFNPPITQRALIELLRLTRLKSVSLPMQSLSSYQVRSLLQQSQWTHLQFRTAVPFERDLIEVMHQKALDNPSILFEVKIVQNNLDQDETIDCPKNLKLIRSIRLVDDSYEGFFNENYQNYF